MGDERLPELDELTGEVNRLWRRANRRSLRKVASKIGATYTAVDQAVHGGALVDWNVVEALVIELGGDPGRVGVLWTAAHDAHMARVAERRRAEQPSPGMGDMAGYEAIANAIHKGLSEIAAAIREVGRHGQQ